MHWLSPLTTWREAPFAYWRDALLERAQAVVTDGSHGDAVRWEQILGRLPDVSASTTLLNHDVVTVAGPISNDDQQHLAALLRELRPWRKGPFDIFGVTIDTEWRSDWKWRRVAPHLAPLAGRTVLDVGCGSGYHLWRMRGAGAARVLGIEPTWLYLAQFHALQRYIHDDAVDMLPLRSEDLPADMACCDTVFSMGVLYHRRDTLAHLSELRGALRDGGELVLETLVVTTDDDTVLTPTGRYAKMRNVWAIPSCRVAQRWLHEAGFVNVRCVDVTPTTTLEQRTTQWMSFESLVDFLDPQDTTRTVEGYPAPTRAVFIANKPQ